MRKEIANLPEVAAALQSLNSANVHRSVQDMMMKKFIAAFEAIDNGSQKYDSEGIKSTIRFGDIPREEIEKAIKNHFDSPIQKLTLLQAELGYVKGEISTVAMLGLVGEAGEVLAECERSENGSELIDETTYKCKQLDNLKKRVRDGSNHTLIYLTQMREDRFDKELADCFYYIQALATNRGLTILDLAQMAHDKVRAKQAAGGSSEDKK